MIHLTNHQQTLGIAICALFLLGCTSGAAESVDYQPSPHLSISLVDPSTVLVHHSAGALLFNTQLGIGGEGIYREISYKGFSRSLDVFGDGSVVMVPIIEGGQQTTGLFVNLPSGRKFLFTERGAVGQLSRRANVRVFGLLGHTQHDYIAHFPDFQN